MECDGGFTGGMCRSSTAGGGGSQGTTQLCGSGDLMAADPEFPPKPDVISTGYISYGHYVRDYNPPAGVANNRNTIYETNVNQTVLPPVSTSVLNVSDPRFSATYGNPYLKQVPNIYLISCTY